MICDCGKYATQGRMCYGCMEAQLRTNASNITPRLIRSDESGETPVSNDVRRACTPTEPVECCPCGCASVEWVGSHEQCGGCGRVIASCCEGSG